MSDDGDPKQETMTSREVAELLGLDRNRVFRLARTKPDFPKPFQIAPKKYYWLRSDALAYRDKQTEKPADE